MKTLSWQRAYPAEYQLDRATHPSLLALKGFDSENLRAFLPDTQVYQSIAHWFVFMSFGSLIGGIAMRRI